MADDKKMRKVTVNLGASAARRDLAGRFGSQYGGHRDVFAAAGYSKDITFDQYRGRYERQDIAARIVDAAPEECWRNPPEVLDGQDLDEAKDDTPFVSDWRDLLSVEQVGKELEDRKTLWHYMQRVDRLAGIGHYGSLLLGVNDGQALDQPLRAGSVSGPSGFLYLSAFDEGDMDILTLDDDRTSRRYGLPMTYRLQMGSSLSNVREGANASAVTVHWSRIIHVAEDLQADEVFGVPRLRPIWNRLVDLEKILAGSGEAAWRLMYKGMVLSTKDGYKLTDDEVTQEKIDEFVHGLTRVVQLEGMDVKDMGGEVVDPTGVTTLNVAFISSATGIPQRILLGSERAELASTQDERNWARVIATRCRNYAEPQILRPLINRLVYVGVLRPPSAGRYVIKWPAFAEPDPKVDSEVAKAFAEALEKMAALTGQTPKMEDFIDAFVKDLSGKDLEDKKEAPAPDPQGQDGMQGQGGAQDEDPAVEDATDGTDQQTEASNGDAKDVNTNQRHFDRLWASRIWERYPLEDISDEEDPDATAAGNGEDSE